MTTLCMRSSKTYNPADFYCALLWHGNNIKSVILSFLEPNWQWAQFSFIKIILYLHNCDPSRGDANRQRQISAQEKKKKSLLSFEVNDLPLTWIFTCLVIQFLIFHIVSSEGLVTYLFWVPESCPSVFFLVNCIKIL